MKKLTILMIFIVTVLSCTAENVALWNEVDREMKERQYGCYVDPYSGNTHCGYRR